MDPYSADDDRLWTAVREKIQLGPGNPTNPARKLYQSETGEITIDAPGDLLVLDTPRTAGGCAAAGRTLETSRGGVRVTLEGSDATVWVSALDGQPIRSSRRLLVTHLTDLQNSGIKYAEAARQTLLDWGQMPHLVRAGKAAIALRLQTPKAYRVWVLAPSGKRLAEAPAQVEGDTLRFTADVAGDPSAGARLLYEVVAE